MTEGLVANLCKHVNTKTPKKRSKEKLSVSPKIAPADLCSPNDKLLLWVKNDGGSPSQGNFAWLYIHGGGGASVKRINNKSSPRQTLSQPVCCVRLTNLKL